MIEVVIDSIRVSLISQQRIVMLRDIEGEQQLPIWIGPWEAESIAIELQDTELARPLTHDLLRNVIEQMGGTVTHILISRLEDNIFYAILSVNMNGSVIEIDCRPSDAISLGVRVKVPIYVAEAVMSEAGVLPEADINDETDVDDTDDSGEEEVLDAFKDFLDTLDFEE
jgi:bifunctional DNase/RNase